MGYCLPACIAASLNGTPERVLGICGDGGFQMTIGELAVAVQHKLDFVLVVFNNGILARIAAIQTHKFGSRLVNPDFDMLATAYGCGSATVTHSSDIRPAIEKAIAHEGSPFIINVMSDPKILAPMSKWEDGFTPVHFA
jgi:acetolactate synthase-1/2/3 large subunit